MMLELDCLSSENTSNLMYRIQVSNEYTDTFRILAMPYDGDQEGDCNCVYCQGGFPADYFPICIYHSFKSNNNKTIVAINVYAYERFRDDDDPPCVKLDISELQSAVKKFVEQIPIILNDALDFFSLDINRTIASFVLQKQPPVKTKPTV